MRDYECRLFCHELLRKVEASVHLLVEKSCLSCDKKIRTFGACYLVIRHKVHELKVFRASNKTERDSSFLIEHCVLLSAGVRNSSCHSGKDLGEVVQL